MRIYNEPHMRVEYVSKTHRLHCSDADWGKRFQDEILYLGSNDTKTTANREITMRPEIVHINHSAATQ